MPYIAPERREILDPYIEALRDKLLSVAATPGDLNYAITRLVASQYLEHPSYTRIAELTGVLDNVKQEFYRRIVNHYEARKDMENGDVHEFYQFIEVFYE